MTATISSYGVPLGRTMQQFPQYALLRILRLPRIVSDNVKRERRPNAPVVLTGRAKDVVGFQKKKGVLWHFFFNVNVAIFIIIFYNSCAEWVRKYEKSGQGNYGYQRNNGSH